MTMIDLDLGLLNQQKKVNIFQLITRFLEYNSLDDIVHF